MVLELLAGEAAVAFDRAAAIERLTGLARTDPLTELSNRRAFEDELSRELARAERTGQQLSRPSSAISSGPRSPTESRARSASPSGPPASPRRSSSAVQTRRFTRQGRGP